MRIIVCIKQIINFYAKTGKEVEKNYLASEDAVLCINPYDISALSLALQVRKALEGGDITLLTMGPLKAEEELRRCMAVGADRLYQIDVEGPLDLWQKSKFLARAIVEIGADLVLCGKESLDSRNGQVGALLAHNLGIGFVSSARELTVSADQKLIKVQRSAGRGVREVIECSLPAVCSVDEANRSFPLPTYDQKKKAWEKPVHKFVYDKKSTPSKVTSIGTYPPRPRPKILPPPDSKLCAYDRISQLLTGSQIEKGGEIVTGDPVSQAEAILQFLKRNGFLELKSGEKD